MFFFFVWLNFKKDLRIICEKFLQLRGIVIPKWKKLLTPNVNKIPNIDGVIKKNLVNWKIDCYSYTFSKHIVKPTKIRFKSNQPIDLYSRHLLACPFGRINKLNEKFRIYPPLVKL